MVNNITILNFKPTFKTLFLVPLGFNHVQGNSNRSENHKSIKFCDRISNNRLFGPFLFQQPLKRFPVGTETLWAWAQSSRDTSFASLARRNWTIKSIVARIAHWKKPTPTIFVMSLKIRKWKFIISMAICQYCYLCIIYYLRSSLGRRFDTVNTFMTNFNIVSKNSLSLCHIYINII